MYALPINYVVATVGCKLAGCVFGVGYVEVVVLNEGHCTRTGVPVGVRFALGALPPYGFLGLEVYEQAFVFTLNEHQRLVGVGE